MPDPHRRTPGSRGRLAVALAAALVLPLVLWAFLPVVSAGAPSGRAASLEKRIDSARKKVERARGTERLLSGDVAAYSRRIGRLQGRITALRGRQLRLQDEVDARRAELLRIQTRLRRERARLVRLRARLRESRAVLAERLVERYKADSPDLVTVVLSAQGFADLLERGEFIRRISEQDREVVEIVRDARADAVATARRLDRLERRQQRVTAAILARRNEVAQVKGELIGTRVGYERTRAGKQRALNRTRVKRAELEGHLDGLEREQSRVLTQLRDAQERNAGGFDRGVAGPVRQGSGSLVWPVNGPIVSPFGQRWGRLHAGVDIAAPSGTPIRAADGGRVVLLGVVGGYGNYTCVQHSAALSTCYAHQSRFATSNGASVSKGQVIGYVGCTGRCFGDHLHFEVRVNGSPVNPAGYL